MKNVTTKKKKTRKRVISLKTIIIGNITMVTMRITNTMATMGTTKTWLTTPTTITMETTNGNTG